MRALTVAPGVANSIELVELPAPPQSEGSILAQTLALGVCGTDREIIAGQYGAAPPGHSRLVLGHESLGLVKDAPSDSGFVPGDLMVGIVRRPDPVPCACCAAGEWDMCRNGRYSERGIKERNGYGAEFFRIEPEFAVKVDPTLGTLGVLIEPTSIVAKAWDHIDRVGHRFRSWQPRRLLVTGGGPVGLLAALIGKQKGHDVHIFDRHAEGSKPLLAQMLGAQYHAGSFADVAGLNFDIVIECTGAPAVVAELLVSSNPNRIVCLAGISGDRATTFDVGKLNRTTVLDNGLIFGTVNANREHYRMAAHALAQADPAWLSRVVSRRVPLARWKEAFERRPDDIKVIVDFTLEA